MTNYDRNHSALERALHVPAYGGLFFSSLLLLLELSTRVKAAIEQYVYLWLSLPRQNSCYSEIYSSPAPDMSLASKRPRGEQCFAHVVSRYKTAGKWKHDVEYQCQRER